MNIYQALEEDHVKVKEILNQLIHMDVDDDETSYKLIAQIRDELIPHARAEEAVFYNSLRALQTEKDKVRHAYREHLAAETLLRMLQLKDKIDVNWKDTAEKLLTSLTEHIDEEEKEIFAVAKSLFIEEEAAMMGQAFLRLKEDVKKQSAIQTTLEYVTNMMPERFVPAIQSISLTARI